ncbi:hypothetical protein J6T66_02400 [bacterium]|nr:hypothetical protein [bacterium]
MFFNILTHINIAHHKANTEPACSHACFCLGLFSMVGNMLESASQNAFHILEGKASDCPENILVLQEDVLQSIFHVTGITYCTLHFHDGVNIWYKLGFLSAIILKLWQCAW